jgi:hypothetical protein
LSEMQSATNLFEAPRGITTSEKICNTFIEWYTDTPPSQRRFILETLGPVGVMRQIREKILKELREVSLDGLVINISPVVPERQRFFERVPAAQTPSSMETPEGMKTRKRKGEEE